MENEKDKKTAEPVAITQEEIDALLKDEISVEKPSRLLEYRKEYRKEYENKGIAEPVGITQEDIDALLKDHNDNKTPEITKPEKSEKEDGELARLKQEIERTRNAYAGKDYEMTNTVRKLKNIIGKVFVKFKSEDSPDVQEFYGQYKTALNDLLSYQVEKIKEKNLPADKVGAEIGTLAKYFNQDEKLNLYEAFTDAKTEAWNGNKLGKVAIDLFGKEGRIIKYNEFRKKHWKAMALAGTVASLSGIGVPMRIIGGVAAGVGISAGLEKKYRKKEGERLAQKRIKMEKELEKIDDPEEKYKMLMQEMQNEVGGYQESLKTDRIKLREKKWMGALAGVFLGSGLTSDLLHAGWEKCGASDLMHSVIDKVKDKFSDSVGSGELKHSINVLKGHSNSISPPLSSTEINSGAMNQMPIDDVYDKFDDFGIERQEIPMHSEMLAAGNIEPGAPTGGGLNAEHLHSVADGNHSGGKILNIEKYHAGGSAGTFEGTIKKDLISNYNMNEAEAGKMAANMRHNFEISHPDSTGHHYDIVHEGDKIKIEVGKDGKPFVADFGENLKVKADVGKIAEGLRVPEAVKNSLDPNQIKENIIKGSVGEDMKGINFDNIDFKNAGVNAAESLANGVDKKTVIGSAAAAGVAGVVGGIAGKEKIKEVGKKAKEKVINLAKKRKEKTVKKAEEKAAEEKEKRAQKFAERRKKNKTEAFKKLAEKYKFEEDDGFDGYAMKIIKKLLEDKNENSKWSAIKDRKAESIVLKKEKLSGNFKLIKDLEKQFLVLLGEKARPEDGETVKHWLARNVDNYTKIEKGEEIEQKMAA